MAEKLSTRVEKLEILMQEQYRQTQEQFRDTDRRLRELGEETDKRIGKLVLAIGELVRRLPTP